MKQAMVGETRVRVWPSGTGIGEFNATFVRGCIVETRTVKAKDESNALRLAKKMVAK